MDAWSRGPWGKAEHSCNDVQCCPQLPEVTCSQQTQSQCSGSTSQMVRAGQAQSHRQWSPPLFARRAQCPAGIVSRIRGRCLPIRLHRVAPPHWERSN